jgi:hypothetical protein
LHLAPHHSRTAAPPQLRAAAQGGKGPRTLGLIARSVRAALNREGPPPTDGELERAVVARMASPQIQTCPRAIARSSRSGDSRVTLPVSQPLPTAADSAAIERHRLTIQASREARRDSTRTGVPETGTDAPDLRWPALPVLDGGLPDAPIRTSDFSHLYREQEQGLWNA